MPASELAAFLAYATAMAFTPGPNTTLSAAMAANHGLAHAMRFVLAVPFGWCLLLVLCAAGVGTLVSTAPALGTAIRVAGAAYMLWLAWKLAQRARVSLAEGPSASALDVGFIRGVALQFVNGKAWINALTIAGTWIAIDGQVASRPAWVLPIAAAYGFASNFTYAAVSAGLRQWLAHGQRLLWFNRAMACVLAATALWMLAS